MSHGAFYFAFANQAVGLLIQLSKVLLLAASTPCQELHQTKMTVAYDKRKYGNRVLNLNSSKGLGKGGKQRGPEHDAEVRHHN